MRHYELVVVLSPILSQEEGSGAWEGIKEVITSHGGDITRDEQWGMRRLAYPIRKAGQTFLEGNYLLTRFSTDTVVPAELEAQLKLSENVLRHLLVRSEASTAVEAAPEAPPVSAGVAEAPVQEVVVAEVAEVPSEETAAAESEAPAVVVSDVEEAREVVIAEAEEPIVAEVEEKAEAEEPYSS